MITKERLATIEELLTVHPTGTHCVMVGGKAISVWTLDAGVLKELVSLTRWCLDHAVPAIKRTKAIIVEDECEECGTFKGVAYNVRPLIDALEALPETDRP